MSLARLVLGLASVLSLAVAADVEFVTPDLLWAIADKPYSPPPLEARSSGACPLGGLGFAVVSGSLPPGIQLSRLGYFSGTPLRIGSWEFAVRVSNGCTWTARHYVIVVTGAPVLTVVPTKVEFSGTTAMENAVQVSSTWPKQSYSITSSAPWLKIDPEQGFTPRQGSALTGDSVRIRVDLTGLKPGRHSATLTFSAWQAANVPVVDVELTIPAQ